MVQLKKRTADDDRKFIEINNTYLNHRIREQKSTEEVYQKLKSIAADIKDPVLGFAIVTNLAYRIAENKSRGDFIEETSALFAKSARAYREYTVCRRSLRWAASSAATLSSLHLLNNDVVSAKATLDVIGSDRILPAWDITDASSNHLNCVIYFYNRALVAIYEENFQEALKNLDHLALSAPAYYAELVSHANSTRLHHIFDIKSLHMFLMSTIPLQYLIGRRFRGSHLVQKQAKANVRPKLLYPRFSQSWLDFKSTFDEINRISNTEPDLL